MTPLRGSIITALASLQPQQAEWRALRLLAAHPSETEAIEWAMDQRRAEAEWEIAPTPPMPPPMPDAQQAHGLQWCAYARGVLKRCTR